MLKPKFGGDFVSLKVEYSLFDDITGEVVSHYNGPKTNAIGEEWIFMFKDAMRRLIDEGASYSVMKTFIYISSLQVMNQTYVVVTKAHIRQYLQMSRKTLWESLKWLQEHHFLQESTHNGSCAFLLNPEVTGCGKTAVSNRKRAWSMNLKLR